MSWVWDDPFDDYRDLASHYDLAYGSVSIASGKGRVGTDALKIAAQNQSGIALIQKNLFFRDTYIVGLAVNVWTGQAPTIDTPLIGFLDGATIQVDLRIRPDGHLVATRNGTELGVSNLALPFGEDHYIEFKALIHGSAGTVTIHLDQVEVLALTGINTCASGANRIGALRIGHTYNPPNPGTVSLGCYVDDLVLLNALGTRLNDFIGDIHLGVIVPDGVGDATDLTVEGAATNWQAVRDYPVLNPTWLATADTTLQSFVAANVLDGDPNTYWMSTDTNLPHWLAFDMGDDRTLELIEIRTLNDSFKRQPYTIELYVSADGINWGSVVETITGLPDVGDTIRWKLAAPQTTQYFKLNVTANAGGGKQVMIAGVFAGVTYVASATVGHKDLYNYQDIDPTVAGIAFASVWPLAFKEDGGLRALRTLCKSNSTEVDNGADLILAVGESDVPAAFEVDPDTGDPWTVAGINAAQFGAKVAV